MSRLGLYAVVLVALVMVAAMVTESHAAYLPSSRVQALKRSVEGLTKPRQKRYSDYQERASSFCTGLCMYEERKSYSECFDICNWY